MSNAVVQVNRPEKMGSGKQLVRCVLAGTMGKDEVPLVSAWAEGLSETIRDTAAGKDDSVCVIVDIRNMETYTDPGVITIITRMMKEDNIYVHRTATFGGNHLHEMIESVIRSLAARNNLKNFKTEEEAMKWLQE